MADSLDKPVIVYDGSCNFCINQTNRIRKLDRRGVFEYLPRQDEGFEERFPLLLSEDFNSGLRLILLDGTILVGADAVHGIGKNLRPWSLIAWIYHIPPVRPLARLLYNWIARNRHRLSRQSVEGTCES